MHQRYRLIVALLALVVGLHVFMLAGLGEHHATMSADHGTVGMAAGLSADGLAEWTRAAHDMAAACIAVVASVILLGAALVGMRRRATPSRLRRPLSPTRRPSTPPPIALGVLRT
jgi:hypothetical protein